MRYKRDSGSRLIVCSLLVVLFLSAISAANPLASRHNLGDGPLIRGDLTARADSSPGEGSSSDGFPDTVSKDPPIDYPQLVQTGAFITSLLQLSDEDAHMRLENAKALQLDDPLESIFTDFGAFVRNGWSLTDETSHLATEPVSIRGALRALRISFTGRPRGKSEYVSYTHDLQWLAAGHRMEVS